jgi:hypothetical protein
MLFGFKEFNHFFESDGLCVKFFGGGGGFLAGGSVALYYVRDFVYSGANVGY